MESKTKSLEEQWFDFARMDFTTAKHLDICDNLTPFGTKVRYPQDANIDETHVIKALKETQELFEFFKV